MEAYTGASLLSAIRCSAFLKHLNIGGATGRAFLLCGLAVLTSNFGSRTLQALTLPPTLCPATRHYGARREIFNELYAYRHLACWLDWLVYGSRVSDRRRQWRPDRAHHRRRDQSVQLLELRQA